MPQPIHAARILQLWNCYRSENYVTKRFKLILSGKGRVGKISDYFLQQLGQPLRTAVGRLVLYKPFLATAAVWLDSAARRCELRLRFCVRKTCPALGTKQPFNPGGFPREFENEFMRETEDIFFTGPCHPR
jgi:hypothetical protein